MILFAGDIWLTKEVVESVPWVFINKNDFGQNVSYCLSSIKKVKEKEKIERKMVWKNVKHAGSLHFVQGSEEKQIMKKNRRVTNF